MLSSRNEQGKSITSALQVAWQKQHPRLAPLRFSWKPVYSEYINSQFVRYLELHSVVTCFKLVRAKLKLFSVDNWAAKYWSVAKRAVFVVAGFCNDALINPGCKYFTV